MKISTFEDFFFWLFPLLGMSFYYMLCSESKSHICFVQNINLIKSHIIHFQIQEVIEMKEFNVKEPLYIFFYNINEMSKFCGPVKVYKLKNL